MKTNKSLLFFAAFALLLACTPEDNPNNDGNNNNSGIIQPSVVELSGIAFTEHEVTLKIGWAKNLDVKFTPENATNKQLNWLSSNTSIVTVTNGTIVGVAQGSAEVIAKSGNLTDKCLVTVINTATSVSLDRTEITLNPGKTATLKATLFPEDSTDELVWSSSDEAVATVDDGIVTALAVGKTTITASVIEKKATCIVKVERKCPEGAVDLGIEMTRPDGTEYKLYWAACNLGASSPEDYGDYYAWGEVETKENYNWLTYKWGTSNNITKYNSVDNKTILDLEDDAAHVNLGGNWRMPTLDEWFYLNVHCGFQWTTQNGVEGCRLTAPNGNSIFLPAAGQWGDTKPVDAGFCFYWSSSLNTKKPYYAKSYSIYREGLLRPDNRCNGYSIRPVTE